MEIALKRAANPSLVFSVFPLPILSGQKKQRSGTFTGCLRSKCRDTAWIWQGWGSRLCPSEDGRTPPLFCRCCGPVAGQAFHFSTTWRSIALLEALLLLGPGAPVPSASSNGALERDQSGSDKCSFTQCSSHSIWLKEHINMPSEMDG